MTSKDALTKNIEINPDLISNNEARSRESINKCHGHAHNGTKLKSTHALTIMMFFTGIFFLIEIIVGNVTHSNTLVADSFHMLSDLISFLIALVAINITKSASNSRNTFGWSRAEVVGSLINSVFLMALCFSIMIEACNRFFEPHPLKHIDYIISVGIIGLIINIFGMIMLSLTGETHLHSHSHGKHKENLHAHSHLNERKSNNLTHEKFLESQKTNDALNPIEMRNIRGKNKKSKLNMNIRGVLLHVLADALGSVSVIVSSLVVKYFPSNEKEFQWKIYVDPILSLVISFFIIISTIPLFRQSSLILLQAIPHEINFEQLKKEICKIKSLQRIESFHVWSLNSELVVASINLSLSSENSEQLEVFKTVQKILKDYNINLSSIQISIDSQNSTNEISNLNTNMSNLTFNELRNDRNENAIFDLSKNIEI